MREIALAPSPREGWGRTQVDYLVKIEIVDANAELKPGMSAILDIITNRKDKVLTLGHEFIQKDNDKYFVMLKNGVKQDIKVGLQNETAIEITNGLSEGQEVKQVDFLELIEKKQ